METIPKADCEKIGFFKKTHGVFGNLVLEFEPKYELSVENADRYFVELEGLLVPFFVAKDGFRFRNANSAIVTFDDVETEKYAKRMVGCSAYLYQSEIIQDSEDNIQEQFLNYLLIDENHGEIGKINQIDDYSGNMVFSVNYRGKELLVPFNVDFLLEIDENKKTIKLNLPEGLIENE